MHNLIVFAAVLAAAALFAWLCLRLGRAQSRSVRWIGTGFTGIIALVLLLICAAAGAGFYRQHSRSASVPELKVEDSAEDVHRGKAIADSFCGGCHSRTATLTGGFDVGKDLPLDLGTFLSSNLTAAGSLKQWSDGEIFRAIRNGVDANGHWLVIMSLTNAGKLSDDDVHALIAYIRSLPAAGAPTPDPPDHFNFLGLIMLGVGQFPSGKPVNTGVVTAPLKAPTVQYGEYILSYQDCRECHGQDLSGGVAGQLPPIGPGLSIIADWSRDDFIATFRTGKDPGGHALGDVMPWPQIGKMDDVELSAMYEYLKHMFSSGKAAGN
jgi:cytochrome c553